jgi:hypothetical protein
MAKRVIEGKVRAWHHMIYTVQKGNDSEKEIVIHFGHGVNYRVVKLDSSDLPAEDDRHRKITWWNDFGIQDESGKKFLKKVRYTVFVPKLAGRQELVYYANGRLKSAKPPRRRGTKSPRPRTVQFDLTTGDPGIGCRDADPKPIR